jgi:hypothetical protein
VSSEHDESRCPVCTGEPGERATDTSDASPIYVLWHGGPNYADPWISDDLEVFENVEAAHDALIDRERNGHWMTQRVHKRNGDVYTVYFPNVDRSYMEVFYADPIDETGYFDSTEPDLRLYFNQEDNDE